MDSIQFQTAEFADNTPKCSACKVAIPDEFYQLAGQTVCAGCAELVRKHQELPTLTMFTRGLLYGVGAAFVCSLAYAGIVIATGVELGIVAIAVGYLVGMAIRKGSNGWGGRRSQIAAVLLTYLAITSSTVIAALWTLSKNDLPGSVSISAVLSIILIGPFEDLADVGGIVGMVILVVGLMQAWRITAADHRVLTGPFRREEPAVA